MSSTWCHLCEHSTHVGRCPVGDPGRCCCMETVILEPIDLALWTIRVNLPRWELNHLDIIAKQLGKTIPQFPTVTQRRLGII